MVCWRNSSKLLSIQKPSARIDRAWATGSKLFPLMRTLHEIIARRLTAYSLASVLVLRKTATPKSPSRSPVGARGQRGRWRGDGVLREQAQDAYDKRVSEPRNARWTEREEGH